MQIINRNPLDVAFHMQSRRPKIGMHTLSCIMSGWAAALNALWIPKMWRAPQNFKAAHYSASHWNSVDKHTTIHAAQVITNNFLSIMKLNSQSLLLIMCRHVLASDSSNATTATLNMHTRISRPTGEKIEKRRRKKIAAVWYKQSLWDTKPTILR